MENYFINCERIRIIALKIFNMGIEVKKEEQYTLLNVHTSVLTTEDCEKLKNTIATEMESGAKNFIIGIKNVEDVGSDFYVTLDTVTHILQKEDGILVICEPQGQEIITALEKRGMIITHSFDEAVDYVFMVEIEKQLDAEDDEEINDL